MTSKKRIPIATVLEVKEFHTSFHGLFFKSKNLLFSQQSSYQKIEVIEHEYYGRILFLDGLVQTTERDEFFYHELLVHPAFVSHPRPKNILIIGGGDGGAIKEILRYPIEHVWFVEIDSKVIEVSKKFFPWLGPVLKDKRVEFVIADGNEFIQKTELKFDVVLVDSSDPVGPSRVLHEKNFFENIKNCLNTKGVVVSQIGSPYYHLEQIKEKITILNKIFNIVRMYISPVPTYPGGSWCFMYLSDEVNHLSLKREPPSGLKYYNKDIHRAVFALPNFLKY